MTLSFMEYIHESYKNVLMFLLSFFSSFKNKKKKHILVISCHHKWWELYNIAIIKKNPVIFILFLFKSIYQIYKVTSTAHCRMCVMQGKRGMMWIVITAHRILINRLHKYLCCRHTFLYAKEKDCFKENFLIHHTPHQLQRKISHYHFNN